MGGGIAIVEAERPLEQGNGLRVLSGLNFQRAVKTKNTLEVEVSKLNRIQRELEAEIDDLKTVSAVAITPPASS